ncbi:MAG: HEAT repeat domain-containing protein [Acidobacteria bacterium]|nr:HEAT repeat domain-containing protein [Acidobacteriota bacterium]
MIKSENVSTPHEHSLAAAPGRAAVRGLLLVFSALIAGSIPDTHAQTSLTTVSASSLQSLTPLQREIERQRSRLNSSDVEERRDAVLRLGALARPDSSRVAAAALTDSATIVRATAARSILSLPPGEAVVLLVPLLNDKNEFVRREAAYALGETRSRAAVEPLVTALARDREAGVRGAAAVSLGLIKDEAAVPALSEALGRRIARAGFLNRITFRKREENDFVRRAAVVALGQIGSREAVPALVAVLSNERAGDDVRREAARALGLIGDVAAVPALRAVVTASDPYLSQIAVEALRKLKSVAPLSPKSNVQSPKS